MTLVKISKEAAGFQNHPETNYLCQECIFLKPLGKAPLEKGKETAAGCAFFGPSDPVSPTHGGCNDFKHGEPGKFDIPWLNLSTKEESGYVESKYGFTCKRCEYVDLVNRDCERVDKDSPGPVPGAIDPNTCCSVWEEDDKRAGMTTEKLMALIAKMRGSKLKGIVGQGQ